MNLFPSDAVLFGLILFIITYFISSKLFILPTLTVIRKRQTEIFDAEDLAKHKQSEAEKFEKQYFAQIHKLREQGTAIRAKHRAEALAQEKRMIDEVQTRMRSELERLDAELVSEIQKLYTSLEEVRSSLAVKVAENILGRPLRINRSH